VKEADSKQSTIERAFEGVYGYHKPYTPLQANLSGRAAILTGAAGSIGREVALLYAACGARVAVWDINDQAGAQTVRKIAENGGEAYYDHVDITDGAAMEAALRKALARYGKIDILFANAGSNFGNRMPATEMDEALFDLNLDVNLVGGAIMLSRLVLPHMMAQGGGNIIFTTSVCGVAGLQKQCGFVASRFAINALTRSLALEYGKYNIRVNALAPGAVPMPEFNPDMSILWKDCFTDGYESNFTNPGRLLFDIAARRPGHPTEMAGLVLYFASDDASYTTGQVVCVDGGWTAGFSGDY